MPPAPATPFGQPPAAPGGAAAAGSSVYALTDAGVLLLLRSSGRTLDKSVNLQVPAAFALAASPGLVACACSAGVVRLFTGRTLAFRTNLPRPSARGPAEAAMQGAAAVPGVGAAAGPLFPDAVACSFDSSGERLTVGYSDRNIAVWDVRNTAKARIPRGARRWGGGRRQEGPPGSGSGGQPGRGTGRPPLVMNWHINDAAVPICSTARALFVCKPAQHARPSGTNNQAAAPAAVVCWLRVWMHLPLQVARLRCIMSHADSVWDVALIPSQAGALVMSTAPQQPGSGTPGQQAAYAMPVLATCSADGTVHLWNVCADASASTAGATGMPTMPTSGGPGAPAGRVTRTLRGACTDMEVARAWGRSHHAREGEAVSSPPRGPCGACCCTLERRQSLLLVKGCAAAPRSAHCHPGVLHTAATGSDAAPAQQPQRRCLPESPLPAPGAAGATAAAGQPRAVQLRCLRASPSGHHLAAGDSKGNIHVWDLRTGELTLFKEAHDAEVLSLDYYYSPWPLPPADGSSSGSSGGPVCYLASGSRDALIHIFDVQRGYELVATCEAHAAAVTAVRFCCSGQRVALLSCGADRAVIFRRAGLMGQGGGSRQSSCWGAVGIDGAAGRHIRMHSRQHHMCTSTSPRRLAFQLFPAPHAFVDPTSPLACILPGDPNPQARQGVQQRCRPERLPARACASRGAV